MCGLLDEWRDWQKAQGLSERTMTERAATIRHLASHTGVPPSDVTPAHIIAYCGRDDITPTTRATYHATIRAFYKWAVKAGHVEADPTEHTPRPKRPKGQPRPVQTAHVSALLTVVNRRRTRAMITLAAYAGLRVHEVAKFHGEDLDRISWTITVTGKGGKTAMIPAHQAIVELAATMPRRGPWFPAYTTTGTITPSAVSKAIRDTMRRAGFEGKPHQLRHYYATELLENGVDIRIVKDLMRHESIATTEIYTKVSIRQMRSGLDLLPMVA